MIAVIQRVKNASVSIDNNIHGKCEEGLMILLGVANEDTVEDVIRLSQKILKLRIFCDENGKMNLSIDKVAGKILSISQFTLYADTRYGNRPSFTDALNPTEANKLYEYFNEKLRSYNLEVFTGVFGADMKIELINDGPVTIIYDEVPEVE